MLPFNSLHMSAQHRLTDCDYPCQFKCDMAQWFPMISTYFHISWLYHHHISMILHDNTNIIQHIPTYTNHTQPLVITCNHLFSQLIPLSLLDPFVFKNTGGLFCHSGMCSFYVCVGVYRDVSGMSAIIGSAMFSPILGLGVPTHLGWMRLLVAVGYEPMVYVGNKKQRWPTIGGFSFFGTVKGC